MGHSVTEKIIASHLVSGDLTPGQEIALRIDQTLTQDATGTMAYLQFEAMGVPRVRTELSVSYVDHNMLQTGFENADDHRFLQSIAAHYGIIFSRPGNGICHQVHLERFGIPGKTLLGSDSHTPTCGGLGMLAIGAGGLEVAVAMGGAPFYLLMPRVTRVELTGTLPPWVTAKDIILELLRRLTVKGGVGRVFEYGGAGIAGLTVPERATITNMGAELGATTSVFPSDEQARAFLQAQGREEAWVELKSDADAHDDEMIEFDLSSLEPLVARPGSPDAVSLVSDVAGTKLNQVCIGSCTNSSYRDLMTAAAILRGKEVHPSVSLVISPGSRQILRTIAANGALADLIAAGARLLECACGPCVGMGQAPPSGGVSLRSYNRNFAGRSGTPDDQVYLSSPEVAAASALTGMITDPRTLGNPITITEPEHFDLDDSLFVYPSPNPESVEIERGPNIKPLPTNQPLPDHLRIRVLLKLGDNITTDTIMPAGAKVLPLRSNIPAMAEHVFRSVDSELADHAKQAGPWAVVGGTNYGQGSSREHAALAPMYLGLKAVLARSFARIHRANLVNFGILPLLIDDADYDRVSSGDELEIQGLRKQVLESDTITLRNLTREDDLTLRHDLTEREAQIVLAGGLLNYVVQS